MKFFADTADVEAIRELKELGLLDGVTTNPSLIKKSGRDILEVIKEICSITDGPVSGEVIATEADAMIADMKPHGKLLTVNWPLVWDAGQQTAHRLIEEGVIGEVQEFHHNGGNRGPLYHGADKIEKEPSAAEKAASWFYSKAQGGGSLLDYMGYGTTLGTWHLGGRAPLEVTGVWDEPAGLEVDEHAVAIIRYSFGLSKSETRWGTFTDPWTFRV